MMTKIIQIDDSLRLVPYFLADHHDATLVWYQDVDLVELVDGIGIPYSLEKVNAMYYYLEKHGNLFWIEFLEKCNTKKHQKLKFLLLFVRNSV